MKKYEEIFNEALAENIERIKEDDESKSRISKGMAYALTAGGKRLRPIFAMLGAVEAGVSPEVIRDFALGIEFIHTYSLVHDDLPAMDDDDFRRGMPTCHVKYGEGIAVLIGDALLTHGIGLLLKEIKGVSMENQLKAARLLIESIGLKGMIGGQGADILNENNLIEDQAGKRKALAYIHRYKTGKLLEASLLSGAILGGASEGILARLSSYAEKFGLVFQITDDILDITSTDKELGKPTGSDIKNIKLTYPNLYGLERSQEMAAEIIAEAILEIAELKYIKAKLTKLAEYVLIRKK